MSLTPLGTLSYNGYTFTDKAETVALRGVPEFDAAKRTIVNTTWTITIKDHVTNSTPGSSIDTAMETIRQQLWAQGGVFTYQNRGLGNLVINTGTKKDVRWGPKPLGLEFKVEGRDQAHMLIWTVQVCVPEGCSNASYSRVLMAVNYEVAIDTDFIGYSTRTTSGYFEIPMTRTSASSKTIPDDADNYFERVWFPIPLGFRRTKNHRVLSNDRRRCDFAFVDEEMPPAIPPATVANLEVTHSVTTREKGLCNWVGTFTGTYTMSRQFRKSDAFWRFWDLVFSRIDFVRQFATSNGRRIGNSIIPLAFSMAEPIYGKDAGRLSFSYSFVCDIYSILGASGLWRPVPGATNPNAWLSSLTQVGGPMSPRGNASLRHLPSQDVIVDLCSQPSVALSTSGQTSLTAQQRSVGTALRTFPYPAPETSWLEVDNRIRVHVDPGISILKSLPTRAASTLSNEPQYSWRLNQGENVAGGSAVGEIGGPKVKLSGITGRLEASSEQTDAFQATRTRGVWFHMFGHAVRAGYDIDPPVLGSVGGIPVYPVGGASFDKTVVANLTYPVIGATWSQWYYLPNGFGDPQMLLPDNPVVSPGQADWNARQNQWQQASNTV